jgi:hypothetical protein
MPSRLILLTDSWRLRAIMALLRFERFKHTRLVSLCGQYQRDAYEHRPAFRSSTRGTQ